MAYLALAPIISRSIMLAVIIMLPGCEVTTLGDQWREYESNKLWERERRVRGCYGPTYLLLGMVVLVFAVIGATIWAQGDSGGELVAVVVGILGVGLMLLGLASRGSSPSPNSQIAKERREQEHRRRTQPQSLFDKWYSWWTHE